MAKELNLLPGLCPPLLVGIQENFFPFKVPGLLLTSQNFLWLLHIKFTLWLLWPHLWLGNNPWKQNLHCVDGRTKNATATGGLINLGCLWSWLWIIRFHCTYFTFRIKFYSFHLYIAKNMSSCVWLILLKMLSSTVISFVPLVQVSFPFINEVHLIIH